MLLYNFFLALKKLLVALLEASLLQNMSYVIFVLKPKILKNFEKSKIFWCKNRNANKKYLNNFFGSSEVSCGTFRSFPATKLVLCNFCVETETFEK